VGKRIAIALLLLPAAELAVFGIVAWAIGFWRALALMVVTSLAGALVLRRAGRHRIDAVRGIVRGRGGAEAAPAGAVMVALGGILLLLPGFITDIAGAGLLIGPLRRRFGAMLIRAIARTGRGRERDRVIDLAPDEWRPVPDHELPGPDRR
jgi:UPF0716 protein FxsA